VLKALITVAEEFACGKSIDQGDCADRRKKIDRGKGREKDPADATNHRQDAKLHELGLKQLASWKNRHFGQARLSQGKVALSRTRVEMSLLARSMNSRSASAKADRIAPPHRRTAGVPGARGGPPGAARQASHGDASMGSAQGIAYLPHQVKEIEESSEVGASTLNGLLR